MAVRGVDILIYVNTGTDTTPTWTAVGGQRNAKLHEETDTIDVTTKDSQAKEFEYGLPTWTISCDGVYIADDEAYEALKTALRQKQKVKVRVYEAGTPTQEGLALVTSRDLEGPYDDMATYSVELQGTGLLTQNPTP